MVTNKTDLKKRLSSLSRTKAARKSPVERNRPPVFVEFPMPLYSRLEAAAAKLGVTKSDIVREATATALDSLEAAPEK